MKFIDTHSHIYAEEFDSDRQDVIKRAVQAGLTGIVLPNIGLDSIARMKATALANPELFSMAMGIHPEEIGHDNQKKLEVARRELSEYPELYVAVGEIGIDLYWDTTYEQAQMDAFEQQIAWANELGKSVIIHCRNSHSQILEVLQSYPDTKGVFHCFGGTSKEVEEIRRCGDFYFGIGGVVTFRNSQLGETLPAIGLSRIVLETDAPYLAPVPFRGKRNESAYIPIISRKISEVFSVPEDVVADVTTQNARTLFSLKG